MSSQISRYLFRLLLKRPPPSSHRNRSIERKKKADTFEHWPIRRCDFFSLLRASVLRIQLRKSQPQSGAVSRQRVWGLPRAWKGGRRGPAPHGKSFVRSPERRSAGHYRFNSISRPERDDGPPRASQSGARAQGAVPFFRTGELSARLVPRLAGVKGGKGGAPFVEGARRTRRQRARASRK